MEDLRLLDYFVVLDEIISFEESILLEDVSLIIYIVKPRKNSIFLKKGKTVISIENRKFSRYRMMKQTLPLNSYREI